MKNTLTHPAHSEEKPLDFCVCVCVPFCTCFNILTFHIFPPISLQRSLLDGGSNFHLELWALIAMVKTHMVQFMGCLHNIYHMEWFWAKALFETQNCVSATNTSCRFPFVSRSLTIPPQCTPPRNGKCLDVWSDRNRTWRPCCTGPMIHTGQRIEAHPRQTCS